MILESRLLKCLKERIKVRGRAHAHPARLHPLGEIPLEVDHPLVGQARETPITSIKLNPVLTSPMEAVHMGKDAILNIMIDKLEGGNR